MTQTQENKTSKTPGPPPSARKIALALMVVGLAVAAAWAGTADFTQLALLRMRTVPDLERSVREAPQSPWPAYVLGVRYARSGRLNEATRLLERARQTAPDSFDVRFALGKVYALTSNPQAALTELKKASEMEPRNGQVFMYLGRVQRLTGDTAGAKDSEKLATSLDPSNAEAWYQFGVLYPSGASNEADGRAYLKKAAELRPDNGVYAFAYGQSLADGAQFSEAIPFLRTAAKALPNDPSAHFLLGLALHRGGGAGDNDQAIGPLKRAIELNPADFRAHFELANIQLEQGKYDRALPELRTATKLNPSRPEVWAALRTAADRTGHKSIAADAQRQFELLRADHVEMEKLMHHLAQAPDDAGARIRMGQLLEKQGNLRSAAIYYAAVLEHDPNDLKAHALLDLVKERMLGEQRKRSGSGEGAAR